jgi:hypothetical protein
MIAPSPDWFSGFSGFDARVSASAWYQEFEIETFPWDAGTANDNFRDENEHMPVFLYSINRLPSSGAFSSIDGSTVLPVVRWTCTLLAPPAAAATTAPSVSPSSVPSNEPSTVPSASPSSVPSAEPSSAPAPAPVSCTGEGEACSSHGDCCNGSVCFVTCTAPRRVPSGLATSKGLFIIGIDAGSRLRGSGRRH